jgi:hypothetical protein
VADFFKQSVPLLCLNSCYTDWVRANFRQIIKHSTKDDSGLYFSTSYLNHVPETSLKKIQDFYRLLQLLNFIKDSKNMIETIVIRDQTYLAIQFHVNSFLDFIGKPKNNHYQVKQLINFRLIILKKKLHFYQKNEQWYLSNKGLG